MHQNAKFNANHSDKKIIASACESNPEEINEANTTTFEIAFHNYIAVYSSLKRFLICFYTFF